MKSATAQSCNLIYTQVYNLVGYKELWFQVDNMFAEWHENAIIEI